MSSDSASTPRGTAPNPWHRRLRLAMARRFRRPGWSDLAWLALLTGVALLFSAAALWLMSSTAQAQPLSAGDRLQVLIDAGEEFSGRYQLDVQGRIQLPYAGTVTLAGLEMDDAAQAISDRLVNAGLFRRPYVRTSVMVTFWAPLDVRVSGAVFRPGAVRVNQPERNSAPDHKEDLPGASLPERRLSDALRAAGGVTPWADVAHVAVRRLGQVKLYDLWGLVLGVSSEDPPLQNGDEVLVPLLSEAQPGLTRASAITPPGIKIYVSNLIQPAASNSQATASGGQMSLAYGARFSQAVVAANCVGGIVPTSANRTAVLVRTDRASGRTLTWDAPVELIIRNPGATPNPLLQEGDAVACYDADVTGLRDVFRLLSEILNPFTLLKSLRQ
jgi:polysaccharide export outer membrane protein